MYEGRQDGQAHLAQRYQPLQEARFEQPELMLGFQARSWAIVMFKPLTSESHVSCISNWYVVQVLGRQSDWPTTGKESPLISRAFFVISPYVETLFAPEMDTQVSLPWIT